MSKLDRQQQKPSHKQEPGKRIDSDRKNQEPQRKPDQRSDDRFSKF